MHQVISHLVTLLFRILLWSETLIHENCITHIMPGLHPHFSPLQTLLKPSGGFLFDGNKVLIDLECKNFKTSFEEEIVLPTVTSEMPFPVIHTSPFSVGGFAWQVRINRTFVCRITERYALYWRRITKYLLREIKIDIGIYNVDAVNRMWRIQMNVYMP